MQTVAKITSVLAPHKYELILVDDGSSDGSSTLVRELAQYNSNVIGIFLSRNFGHQNAVSAGLKKASGDAVVVMDADLQDPPELIEKFIELWLSGYDVVYGIRSQRLGESWLKRLTAHLFYRALGRLSKVPIPDDAGDFRLMSRRVVNILNAMPEYHRYIRGMVAWAGFKQIGVPYNRNPRFQGKTHYSWRKMWHLSLDGITSFSVEPLRWIRRIALVVAAIALVVSIWLINQKLSHPHSPALVLGWTSLMVTILWLGAAQLAVLGIIGEYIGRIMEQGQQRPQFIIEEIVTSENPSESQHDPKRPVYQREAR